MERRTFFAALPLLALLATPVAAAAKATGSDVASARPARAWVAQLDGNIVGARAARDRLPPASLTKIMTAILWRMKPERQDEVVTVSRRAAAATGMRAGLKAGERYRGADLLAVMLLSSANDACIALAEHAGGTVEVFVADMNRAAQVLGLAATHFANPCGHDAPGHLSSALDLLRLSEAALTDPVLREIVALPAWRYRKVGAGETAERVAPNSNMLVGRLEGTRGVKTGYTAQAGKCVIALVERGGRRLIVVLLGADNRWWAAHGFVERFFADAADR